MVVMLDFDFKLKLGYFECVEFIFCILKIMFEVDFVRLIDYEFVEEEGIFVVLCVFEGDEMNQIMYCEICFLVLYKQNFGQFGCCFKIEVGIIGVLDFLFFCDDFEMFFVDDEVEV